MELVLKGISGIFLQLSLLIFSLLSGCGSNQTEMVERQEPKKKPNPGYVVLEDIKYPNVKRMLRLQLPKRITEERLRDMSRMIRKQTPDEFKYLSIWYFIPEIPKKNGIWANAQFYNESLNSDKPEVIEILCLTIPCYKELAEAPLPEADKIVGVWIVEKQYSSSRKVIYKKSGEYFCNDLRCGFSEGGTDYPQTESQDETRFVDKDTDRDEFYLINQNGDLELRSEDGCFAIGKKLAVR